MAAAALTQRKRRGDATTHRFVLGGFRMDRGTIVLYAVEQGPALNILRPVKLTCHAAAMCWRTKQAAHQFQVRHGVVDVHVVDVGFLDVLDLGR